VIPKAPEVLLQFLRHFRKEKEADLELELDLSQLEPEFLPLAQELLHLLQHYKIRLSTLAERHQKLEQEAAISLRTANALAGSHQLLNNITQGLPQPIIVIDRSTNLALFMNSIALEFITADPDYIEKLSAAFVDYDDESGWRYREISYFFGGEESFLAISSYLLDWGSTSAEAFVVNDISSKRSEIIKLEEFAYRDSMTGLFNRCYGMLTLNEWALQQRTFALVFADLDRLKFINDAFGHSEGDQYIINSGLHLKTICPHAVVSRIGGDEFMVLVPDIDYDEAVRRMEGIYYSLLNDRYLVGKSYEYSMSFGVVVMNPESTHTVSELLSMADERMYANKRQRKMERAAL